MEESKEEVVGEGERVMEAGDAEKRRREMDREVVVTERIIDAEQKREDVTNGVPSVTLLDECEGGVCRAVPSQG